MLGHNTINLPLKEKLKRLYNNKILWIIGLCLIQGVFVVGNLFCYVRTNYCCDVYISSPIDCKVSFVTIIGGKQIQNIEANVAYRENKRPLAEVIAPQCATITYSSDKVQITDILTYTMITHNYWVVWLALTYLCVLEIVWSHKQTRIKQL